MMKCKILGSGGAISTPRPFCNDWLSNLARQNGGRLIRASSCFWIDDIASLVDCPESIGESANKHNITTIKNIFITHWHPDHTFGLRIVLESHYDFYQAKTPSPINLYMPKQVYEDIKKVYPSIDFFIYTKGTANLNFIEHGDKIQIEDVSIEAIGYTGNLSHTYGYKFVSSGKSLLYAPCDTISLTQDLSGLDVLIHECGIFSHDIVTHEISFPHMIERIKTYSPKKTILTHIEHIELEKWGLDYLDTLKQQHSDVAFEFAYDGFEIVL